MRRRLHLATNRGSLCVSQAARPAVTGSLDQVSCLSCLRSLDLASVAEAEAARERVTMRRYEVQARQVGLGDIWDHLAPDDTPTAEMLRGVFGALAGYLIETGYAPEATS